MQPVACADGLLLGIFALLTFLKKEGTSSAKELPGRDEVLEPQGEDVALEPKSPSLPALERENGLRDEGEITPIEETLKAQVERLRNQRFMNKEIAKATGHTLGSVTTKAYKLIKEGRIKKQAKTNEED